MRICPLGINTCHLSNTHFLQTRHLGMGNVLGFNRAQHGALYLQVHNLDVTREVFERLDWFMYYYDQMWMGLNLLRIRMPWMCGYYWLVILCQWMWFQINCFFSLLSNIVADLIGRQFSLAFQMENTAFHFYTQPLFSNSQVISKSSSQQWSQFCSPPPSKSRMHQLVAGKEHLYGVLNEESY